MNTHETTWNTYASAWKVPTTEEKRALLQQTLATDCTYTDPHTVAAGQEELITYMLQFHEQVPGAGFHTVEFFDHHDRSIARWEMQLSDGTVIGTGMSYGTYDAQGKLTSMTGFFEVPDA